MCKCVAFKLQALVFSYDEFIKKTFSSKLLNYKNLEQNIPLQKFYKSEVNRREMYIRYIYKLCDLHLSCGNHTEAAFTLKLHSELLGWDNQMLGADGHFKEQPEWQRKEALFLRIISYFDVGKV